MYVSANPQTDWVERLVEWLAAVADALPSDRAVVAAVSDDGSRASDVFVRGLGGRLAVVLGLPENERPALGELLAVAAGDLGGDEVPPAATQARTTQVAELLAATAACAVMLVDADGAIMSWNTGGERIFGRGQSEAVGMPFSALFGGADVTAERPEELLRRAALGGEHDEEGFLERRDGSRFWGWLAVRAMWDGDRRVYSVLVRDLQGPSGRGEPAASHVHHNGGEASDGELRSTVERLQATNRELEEFTRVTAHDLAGPLRAVAGIMDLALAEPSRDRELVEMLEAVRASVERMRAMIDGAVGYALAGEASLERAPVSLGMLVDRVLDVLAEEVSETGAQVTMDALPTVSGDELQLERVLANLISNALHYSGGRPPRVHISAHREDRAWRIAVADEGIGVDRQSRERIFTLSPPIEGDAKSQWHGIGLATCRRIVELHGGHIWVESNAPAGSVFQFTLPDH